MRVRLLSLLPLIAIALQGATAQPLPRQTTDRIDSLFRQWDKTSSPGCAIGIVRNDSLIFSKGYGMANLEYGVPITPQTIFHMASVSKQFTAWSILLLERQGKLSLDDDIRKYLNWFPDLREKITIRNLLNHTSGIQQLHASGRDRQIRQRTHPATVHRFRHFQAAWNDQHPFS